MNPRSGASTGKKSMLAGFLLERLLERDDYAACWEGRRGATRARIVIPHRSLLSDTRVRAAFLRRGYSFESLANPMLLRVVDVGRDGEDCYVALEEIAGVLLDELLTIWSDAGVCMPYPLAARIGVELAQALSEFQRVYHPREGRRKLHGDLTPRGIVLTPNGNVQLVPPCLSDVVELARHEAGSLRLAYKAPEQLRNTWARPEIDERADVFALGVVLWELVAGRRVGNYRPTLKLLGAVAAAQPPRIESLRPDVPAALSRIIERCLRRSVQERPSGPDELASALTDAVPDMASNAELARAVQAVAAGGSV